MQHPPDDLDGSAEEADDSAWYQHPRRGARNAVAVTPAADHEISAYGATCCGCRLDQGGLEVPMVLASIAESRRKLGTVILHA